MNDIMYLFNKGVASLRWLASATDLTYEQVNIIMYFIIIPVIWLTLLEMTFCKKDILEIGAIILLTTVASIPVNTIYDKAVLLEHWLVIFGWNYYQASVITCVYLPVTITIAIIAILIKKMANRQPAIALISKI